MKALLCLVLALVPGIVLSQNNVGIGTTTPAEKLEVAGIVYTNSGGVRFPDMTLQETAAFNDNGPEDAGSPNGNVYMTIATSSPAIDDTIWLLDVAQGGVFGSAGGGVMAVPFIITKEIDTTSIPLFQKKVQGNTLTNARLHFTTSTDFLYQTIELRNAQIQSIDYRNVFRGNGEFAHLEEVTFTYAMIEIKRIGPGADPCFCWNFMTATTCTCD